MHVRSHIFLACMIQIVHFKPPFAGDLYTIVKTGISGDLKFLWTIMGSVMNYKIRSLGSNPFSVETCHEANSNGMFKFWIPIVFTTHFRKSLVQQAKSLRNIINGEASSRQAVEGATAALAKLDNFVTVELKIHLNALTRVPFGWDKAEYGQLHEAGTAGMRVLDQLVRMWASMGLLGYIMTLIHNCLVGRVEVRIKTIKVKVPTVGVSSTQGEVIKLCKTSLSTLSGYKHYLWMTHDERAEVLEECDESFATTAEENAWILQQAADALGGAPVRLTYIVLAGNHMWAQITKTIDMQSDSWDPEYLELWRTYDPTALSWGSLQMLLQDKTSEAGHLTPSQVGIMYQAAPSLFRNLIAGLTKRDKSDRMPESKHKLRHLVTRINRLFRSWINFLATIKQKKKIMKEYNGTKKGEEACAEVIATNAQRKSCVQECQQEALFRFVLSCVFIYELSIMTAIHTHSPTRIHTQV